MSDVAHRQPLLNAIADYARRFPDESAVWERFRAFVLAHERCFERELWAGHVTGSAWLVNRARDRVLLTHHRKLGRWFQLGGHSDGNPDTLQVALAEAGEESGLAVRPLDSRIFDLDIHAIPARGDDPAHFHYDVRFALEASDSETFRVGNESLALAWVEVASIGEFTDEPSMLRMARKWTAISNDGAGQSA